MNKTDLLVRNWNIVWTIIAVALSIVVLFFTSQLYGVFGLEYHYSPHEGINIQSSPWGLGVWWDIGFATFCFILTTAFFGGWIWYAWYKLTRSY